MAKIYDKGQVTIPETVREAAGLAVGDRVVVEAREGRSSSARHEVCLLEFEPPETDREALPWPDARRAARTERTARHARADRS